MASDSRKFSGPNYSHHQPTGIVQVMDGDFITCAIYSLHGRGQLAAVFLFFYFLFLFFKKIFSFSKFTGIYPGRPAAGRPGPGRPAAGRQGFFVKTFTKIFARRSLGAGRPTTGRPAPQAARQRGDCLPRPYTRGWLPDKNSYSIHTIVIYCSLNTFIIDT